MFKKYSGKNEFGHNLDKLSTLCLTCKYQHRVQIIDMVWSGTYGDIWLDYVPRDGCPGRCSEAYMNKNYVYMDCSDPLNWTFERECNGK